MPERHGIYPASLNGGAFVLQQLGSARPNAGAQKLIARAGGLLTRSLVGTAFAEPRITFSVFDLATVLANISMLTGTAISSASKIQYQKRQDQASFATGMSHAVLECTKGWIAPTSIQASQDDTTPATCELELVVLYDGTNVPLRVLTAQSLVGTPAVNQVYYLGKVIFEGSQLDGVRNVAVTPGLQFSVLRSDGDPWARVGSITEINQELRITGVNITGLATLGLNGSAAVSGVTIYFRKGIHGGTRVADNVPEHVSVTMATGDYQVEEIPVDGTGDAQPVLVCTPTGNLAVSTAATIP